MRGKTPSFFLFFLVLLLLVSPFCARIVKRSRKLTAKQVQWNEMHTSLPTPPPLPPSPSLPLVYIWFDDQVPQYQWDVIEVALFHNNTVFFVTSAPSSSVPVELKTKASLLTLVPISSLETPALEAFRKVYIPWGLWEPYEQRNMERFYILHRLMVLRHFQSVLYIDSDAAFLTKATTSLLPPSCDALVVKDNHRESAYDTYRWVVWAGTAVITRPLLASFLSFAPELYKPPYVHLLEEKFRRKPYVCDMSLWYLFAFCSDPFFRGGQPLVSLPSCPRYKFCHTEQFDHVRGHRAEGFKFDPEQKIGMSRDDRLFSLHFQGSTKWEIAKVLFPDRKSTSEYKKDTREYYTGKNKLTTAERESRKNKILKSLG